MVETTGITAEQWQEVVAQLRNDDRITGQMFGFVQLINVQGLLGETLYLQVANETARGFIERHIKEPLLETLQKMGLTEGNTNIGIVVNPDLADSFSMSKQADIELDPVTINPTPTVESMQPAEGSSRLNPKYTFESFVQGESNRFAYAAAFAVAEVPAKAYNPLFIYGNSGLGKTHLLHAIGNYVQQYWPAKRVRYVSSEVFTNDFINAIQTNTSFQFQAKYRQVDVLLIDDIQFLQGKKETQESFFATFNALHESGKQVVITSDVSPKLLNSFDERMRSRFEWGLMTDIQAPELETRIAILRKKAESDKIRISDEILDFMAARISSNIRELEGALIRVTAYAALNRTQIDMNLVQAVLKDMVPMSEDGNSIAPMEIVKAVSDYFKLTQEEIFGKSRSQAIVVARQIAMYLCREKTSMSLPKIGALFGGRDHTTVMYAIKKVGDLMSERRYIYNQVTDIRANLK
ncbi:MAG: chromosomal replication initiator protein DnaA [Microbacteriaceae bacterium]|nr:chromosomal replication initiator protein DnaA [Microbacteriaceae bacterium]